MSQKFKAGDVLQFKNAKSVRREITGILSNGYLWKRPDSQIDETSVGTPDPFFEDGWRLVSLAEPK